MKFLYLAIQAFWLAFLVYFMLERNAIQVALGDKYGWALGFIVLVTLILFLKFRKD